MKNAKSIIAVILCILFTAALLLLPAAAIADANGIEATLTTDKEDYTAEEDVSVTLTLRNGGNSEIRNVTLEMKVPGDFSFSGGDRKKAVEALSAGDTIAASARYKTPAEVVPEPPAGDAPVALFAVLAVAALGGAIALTVRSKKHLTGVLSAFLCCILVAGAVGVGALNASAAEKQFTLTAKKTIKVDGANVELRGEIKYSVEVGGGEDEPLGPDVIQPFDLRVGDINLPAEHGIASYTTEKQYGDEQGSLKLTVSKDSEVYLGINDPGIKDLTDYDFIVFRVFNASDSTVGVGTMWAADTNCAPGEWTEIKVATSLFNDGVITGFPGTPLPVTDVSGFVIRLISGFKPGDVFYISCVRAGKKPVYDDDVIKPFDLNIEDINLPESHGSAEYTTEKAFGEEAGSLKLTVSQGSEVYLGINSALLKDLTDYDYVYFNVYNTTSSAIMVGTFWTADTSCAPGAWTEVRVSKSAFEAGYVQAWSGAAIPATNIDGMVLRLISGFASGDVFYISSVRAGKKDASRADVIKSFDLNINDINLPGTHGAAVYTTEKAFGDEKGSLKLTVSKNSEVYLGINSAELNNLTGYDYLYFNVYNGSTGTIGAGTMWAADTNCAPGEWTRIKVATALFNNNVITGFPGTPLPVTNIDGFVIRLISGFNPGDVFYISSIRAGVNDPSLKDVLKPFDLNIDDINLPASHGSAEYTTEKHYGDEKGSLKVTVQKDSEVYIGLNTPLITDLSSYEYIVFRVFNGSTSTVGAGTMWAADTNCAPGEWTEIKVATSLFDDGVITGFPGTPLPVTNIIGFVIRLISGFNPGDVFYISSVRAV